MTMNFELIRDALEDLLVANETGLFQTVMFQRQRKAAETVQGTKRMVQCFYKGGSFPGSVGQINSPFEHDATYQFDLTTSDKAKVDLATLNNESATAEQRTVALQARQEAAEIANTAMDTLFRNVFQIIMDPANRDLGLPIGKVVKRWINQFQKDDPVETGELVILTSAFLFTCKTSEATGTGIGPPIVPVFEGTQQTSDIETELLEDDVSQTITETT